MSHPYNYEQERDQPLSSQLAISVPVKPARVEDTELVMVDSVPELQRMVEDLSQDSDNITL